MSNDGKIMVGLLFVLIVLVTPWFWNLAKFANCDFEANYRCEAIHGIGVLIPPISYVTVFFDDDGE